MSFKSILATTLIGVAFFTPTKPINTVKQSSIENDTLCEDYWVYRYTADTILKQYKNAMTGKMMADAWYAMKQEYGVEVPLKLALAQAQMESMFGTSSLTRKTKNPYNIVGKNGYVKYSSVKSGVTAYYRLMATKYLKCKTTEDLLEDFTNCRGHRYAEYEGYEKLISTQMNYYERKFGY